MPRVRSIRVDRKISLCFLIIAVPREAKNKTNLDQGWQTKRSSVSVLLFKLGIVFHYKISARTYNKKLFLMHILQLTLIKSTHLIKQIK